MNDEVNGVAGYITVKEYAKRHGLKEGTVRQKIFRGYLPCKKLGSGNHSINLIRANEPWVSAKPGVKPGTKVKHRRSRAEMQEWRRQQAEMQNKEN